MDGGIHGGLAGVVRASGSRHPSDQAAHEFSCSSIIVHDDLPSNELGDPFMATRNDPLLHEALELPEPVLFDSHHNSKTGPLILGRSITDNMRGAEDARTTFIAHEKNLGFSDHDQRMELRSPSNIFSRILHIYPTAKISLSSSPTCASIPKEMTPSSSLVMNDTISMIHEPNSSSGVCVVDNVGMQNPPALKSTGIKRRKGQAKKLVCVPAPAPSNNRPTGEVVPTDLWAWRKYGQKPIKGSPHPRSYYKCSSSKGCLARKQVERSRTDPNMLMITYTSEHNHPWPTHRNVLAGRSTRSQQLKANAAYNSYKGSLSPSDCDTNAFNEEHKVSPTISTINPTDESTTKDGAMLKVEEGVLDAMIDEEFCEDQFQHMNYEPLQSVNDYSQPGDFYAELGELESTDPLNLMFCQGLPREKASIGE